MYVENGKELESIKRCIASQIKTSLTEHRPVNQRVVGLIPSQGTCLGCGPGSQFGACERQPDIDVSLPLFLLPFLCL